MIPSIPCLSKRLDQHLNTQIVLADLAPTYGNYRYYCMTAKPEEWKELSMAQLLTKHLDPALRELGETLNQYEKWEVGRPEMIEDEGVYCMLCSSGKIPLRVWITHDKLRDRIVFMLDFLARPCLTDPLS